MRANRASVVGKAWLLALLLPACAVTPASRSLSPTPGPGVAAAGAPREVPAALAGAEAVAPGISLLRGVLVPGAQPDGNTVLLQAPDGLVVVDSGRHEAHAARILAAAAAAAQPVAVIVNTHWHLDHVAGNASLRAAHPRAQVHASDAIRAAMAGFLADYRTQLLQAIAQAPAAGSEASAWQAEVARIDLGERLSPTHLVTATGARTLAGRRVVLGLERNAVSGGDVWLLDEATRTLVAGDLVTLPVPLLDTACPQGWLAALGHLQRQDFERVVPGHGAVLTRPQFQIYRDAFGKLLACAAGSSSSDACVEGWLGDAQALVAPTERSLARSALAYYLERLRAPDGGLAARYCRAGEPA